jgi:hypothetical protein
MAKSDIIETIGFTLKEETLVNVSASCFDNTLVLETTEPFPGYYEFTNYPVKNDSAKTLFFVTEKLYSIEEIEKVTRDLQQEFKQNFDASPGTIEINGKSYNCIRIYDFERYDSVLELQSWYSLKGVSYKLDEKKINAISKIKIHKQFLINYVEEGIYRDSIYLERYFLEVPNVNIDLNSFKTITQIVRSNIPDVQFDAALTTIKYDDNEKLYIRYFAGERKEVSVEVLRNIREIYIKAIKEVIK